jgi:hypothetical protein
MPNWRQIVVGDAFKISPGGFNHYRDLFLMWPFLLFSIVATANLFSSDHGQRSYALKAALCAAVAILLAKERFILFIAALFFVAVRLAVAVVFLHTWQVLLATVASCGLLVVLIRSRTFANWKPSYATEKGLHILDLIAVVGGLLVAVSLAIWFKP